MLAGGGAIGTVRVMTPETVTLAMSNLMPAGADTRGTFVDGQGFGAGGRVVISRAKNPFGYGLGTFGWSGAAATTAWVDPVNRLRAAGYAQFVPDSTMPFTREFTQSVYASL